MSFRQGEKDMHHILTNDDEDVDSIEFIVCSTMSTDIDALADVR